MRRRSDRPSVLRITGFVDRQPGYLKATPECPHPSCRRARTACPKSVTRKVSISSGFPSFMGSSGPRMSCLCVTREAFCSPAIRGDMMLKLSSATTCPRAAAGADDDWPDRNKARRDLVGLGARPCRSQDTGEIGKGTVEPDFRPMGGLMNICTGLRHNEDIASDRFSETEFVIAARPHE